MCGLLPADARVAEPPQEEDAKAKVEGQDMPLACLTSTTGMTLLPFGSEPQGEMKVGRLPKATWLRHGHCFRILPSLNILLEGNIYVHIFSERTSLLAGWNKFSDK